MRDRVPRKRRIALGFGQDERALEHCLGVIGEAERSDPLRYPKAIDRLLDIERKPLAVGADVRIGMIDI